MGGSSVQAGWGGNRGRQRRVGCNTLGTGGCQLPPRPTLAIAPQPATAHQPASLASAPPCQVPRPTLLTTFSPCSGPPQPPAYPPGPFPCAHPTKPPYLLTNNHTWLNRLPTCSGPPQPPASPPGPFPCGHWRPQLPAPARAAAQQRGQGAQCSGGVFERRHSLLLLRCFSRCTQAKLRGPHRARQVKHHSKQWHRTQARLMPTC